MYPVSGAAIGCLAGGPVGLLLGLKIGAIAALGGGIVGMQRRNLVLGILGFLVRERGTAQIWVAYKNLKLSTRQSTYSVFIS